MPPRTMSLKRTKGDVCAVYHIKWKGFGMADATWELKGHLVRGSPFDNNLLLDQWNLRRSTAATRPTTRAMEVICRSTGRAWI